MDDGSLTPNQDAPANQFVVLDILKDLLAFAENPSGMGSYLTRQLREFFGARIVALVQYQEIPEGEPERIIAIHPDRYRQWEAMGCLRDLLAAGRNLRTATLVQAEDPALEAAQALQLLGIRTAIAVPLMLGNDAVGCLWAIDLLETIRSADTVQTLAMLSPVVALVLRNATFFESLETEIQIRTRELTRSERQYRELTEAVPVGIFHLDAEGNHVYANEQWYGITGLHGFVGGPPRFEKFIHIDDRPESQRLFRQILQSKESAASEFRLVRPDGQTVWVQTRIVPELDEFGNVNGVIGTMVDTTEKVRLEQAHAFLAQGQWLSTGEDIFKAMAGFLGKHLGMDYVCIDRLAGDALEATTLAVWFDGHFEDNVRYTLQDTPCGAAVGKTICCFPSGVRHQFPKDQVLQDMKAESYLATTLWGPNVQPIGLIALIGRKPIRDTRFAEATLNLLSQRAVRELERMDAEEDKARLQLQLLQTQKMDSLGRLAGGVAHDMNNVLGAILSLSSAHLTIQPRNSPVYHAFETIAEAATRGGNMVKSLLSFARQHPAEETDLDLNLLLREDIRLLERTTLAKVQLETALAEDLALVRGDAGVLTNAFMNLCVNAVDAMPENGRLTLRTRNAGPGHVEVEVEDNGLGMTPEVLSKATDPFFTTKETGKGTGLGLSMVYTAVKAHKGQLEIRSVVGQGTCVRMRFPAFPRRVQAPEPPAVSPSGPALEPLKILLVDDDELIRTSATTLMEVLGHSILTTTCGEEAIRALEEGFAPDAIILDMNMPGIGGAGTLPALRALHPRTPVLLATGRADQDALDLVEKYPYVALLAKPFSLEELNTHLAAIGRN